MKEEPKMNYCCDCGWAVKRGLFRKTWYCTCPAILKKNLDTVLCIVDTKRTECRKLRENMFGDHFEFRPCPNYKGELRHHPAIPPMKCPLPCPPLPERVEKAMEEHDAAYLMNQKQKGLEAENKLLKENIKRMVTTLKHHCNHFIALKLCDCFTNRMGSRGCVYKRSDGCDIADFINKYDGKDGEK